MRQIHVLIYNLLVYIVIAPRYIQQLTHDNRIVTYFMINHTLWVRIFYLYYWFTGDAVVKQVGHELSIWSNYDCGQLESFDSILSYVLISHFHSTEVRTNEQTAIEEIC